MPNIIFMSDGVGGLGITPVATTSLYNGVKSGTVGVQTTIKEHGYGSFDHNSAASASAYIARLACLADAGRRISVRMRFDALPASTTGIIRPLTGTATVAEVRLDSAGKLRLYAGASGGVLQATGATTLSTSTWYQISLAYTITNASVSEWRVYLNGALELTASNPASQVTGSNNLRIGWTGTSPGSNKHMYHQDLFIDDGTDLADPGDISVTNKRPSGTGSNNAFDTLGGTSANRWDAVAERPSGTTNYWRHAASTSVIEEYTVEAASAGDDDLTGKTILGWAPWVYWKITAAAGTSNQMIANGSTVSIVSSSSSTQYQTNEVIVASTSYPSSDAVGLQSTGNANDIYLAGCGVFIAYTAGSTSVPVTDTGAISSSETATVTATAPVADTGPIGSSETRTITVTASVADTAPIGSSDAPTIAASFSQADTGPIGSSEAVAILLQTIVADTGAVSSSETATISASVPVADTGPIGSSETRTISATVPLVDTGPIVSSDAPTIAASFTQADTSAIASSESTSITVTVPVSDSSVIGSSEALTIAVTLSVADTGAISSSESITVSGAITPISVVDAGAIGSSESLALTVSVALPDTGAIGSTESATVTATIPLADTSAIVGADAPTVAASFSRADSSVIASSDAITLVLSTVVADTGAISSGEALQIAVAGAIGETATIVSTDSLTIVVSAAMTDTGVIGSNESITVSVTGFGAAIPVLSGTVRSNALAGAIVTTQLTGSIVNTGIRGAIASTQLSGSVSATTLTGTVER